MDTAISKANVREELGSLQAALQQGNLQDVASQLKKNVDVLENTTLNIAITGHSGTGKSSLVNALRGMSDYEKDSAKVGVTETTMEVKGYPHPNFPKVTLWDLPGIGSPNFKAEEYLKDVQYGRYDFFIVAAGERFTENDVKLAHEIKKMGKNFYYVRTKLDQSIQSEKRNPNFNEQETLAKIRKYCCESLQKAGESSPRVFLVSNHNLSMYDFPHLQETLATDLDDLKAQVLIMAWPAVSEEVIDQKKAAMEDLIWKLAFVSCAIGAIPVPGLSLASDISMLMTAVIKMYHVFGLDDNSLSRLAECVGKPIDELRSAIKNTPKPDKITKEFIISCLAKSVGWTTVTVAEMLLDFIPVLGSLFGGASSFATTFFMLRSFLRDVVKDAQNVRAKVLNC